MSIEEIRKFLREHGLEAVPAATPTTGTLADFLSWSPENTAPIEFIGGNFPEGITGIYCNGFSPNNAKFSDAFSALTSVELPNANVTSLILPNSVSTLVLDGNSQHTLDCVLPAALQSLSVSNSQFDSLPALPAGLRVLNADTAFLSTLPDLSGTALETLVASNCGNLTEVGALPATLTTINCNSTALVAAPDLPAPCVDINLGNCSLSSAMVNAILAKLVANGQSNGTLILDGNDEAPVDDGLNDRDTLLARGWTVGTN